MGFENLADLQVLIHTARTGSLTGAAGALGVTPAAASATLKRLEARLGARLFERSTRAMRLTPQGQTLLDYAGRAFELLAEGMSHVADEHASLVGTLRVAAPSDLSRNTLLPWFDEFLRTHPGLRLALTVSDRALDVVRDEVDVALRYGALADSRLVARTLASARPVLCASRAYLAQHRAPETPQDLLQHNCLTFNRGGRRHRVWRFRHGGQWREVRVDGDRHADDASLARECERFALARDRRQLEHACVRAYGSEQHVLGAAHAEALVTCPAGSACRTAARGSPSTSPPANAPTPWWPSTTSPTSPG